MDGLLDTGRLFDVLGLLLGLALGLGGSFMLLLEVIKTNEDKKEGL